MLEKFEVLGKGEFWWGVYILGVKQEEEQVEELWEGELGGGRIVGM